eukprot:scaffold154145_cov40-Tisochrysis_lutea.AAC.1
MTPHRGTLRNRTYVGIAGAMASQWMPVLLDYCRSATHRGGASAATIVALAREASPPGHPPAPLAHHCVGARCFLSHHWGVLMRIFGGMLSHAAVAAGLLGCCGGGLFDRPGLCLVLSHE